MKDQEIRMVPLEEVQPYPYNTKLHPPTQIRKIAQSILTYGWDQPIVVDKEMVIIKGHGRWMAAKEIELTEVPILVNLTMSPEEVMAARIADNKVAESEWDKDALWGEMESLKEEGIKFSDLGFDKNQIRSLFPDLTIDGAEAPEKKPENPNAMGVDRDPTVPVVENFIKPLAGEEAWLRRVSMMDFLNMHQKIIIGVSGGKDSVHEDSQVWVKVNGKLMFTTPAHLVDEILTPKKISVSDSGQIVMEPEESLEILAPSSSDLKECDIVFSPVKYVMFHEVNQELYKIDLYASKSIIMTADHSACRISNYKLLESRASDIKVGDTMVTLNGVPGDSEEADVPDWLLRLSGLWIADGCYALNRKIVISTGNFAPIVDFLKTIPREECDSDKAEKLLPEAISQYETKVEAFQHVADALGCTVGCVKNVAYRGILAQTTGGKDKSEHIYARVNPNGDVWLCNKNLMERLQGLGFIGKCREKRVPEWLYTASKRQIGLFLAGYVDGDGCVFSDGITASSVNGELLNGVRILFQRLGIPTGLSCQSSVGGFSTSGKELWTLSIYSQLGRTLFREQVPVFKDVSVLKNVEGEKKGLWASSRVVGIFLLPGADYRVFDFEVEGTHRFVANGVVVHNSLCALIWCCENLDKSKLKPFFSNIGWGVDWPQAVTYVMLLEKLFDIKIAIVGPTDPKAPLRFHDRLIQMGYPTHFSCWVRNYIKIRNIQYWFTQEGLIPKKDPFMGCQIIAVRWGESKNRAKGYPDRGTISDTQLHYASPVIQWSTTDVGKYIADHGLKLHTAYQHTDRMGCIACPHENSSGAINTRKKFPLLWKQIVEWHGRGSRKSGKIEIEHFKKFVSSIEDINQDRIPGTGPYSGLSLSNDEYEDYIEKVMGIKLPQRPYVPVPFDKGVHNYRTDLDPSQYGADLAEGMEATCDLVG